jgi:hypothetical protein
MRNCLITFVQYEELVLHCTNAHCFASDMSSESRQCTDASIASTRVLHEPLPSWSAGFKPVGTNNIRMQFGLVTQMIFGLQYGLVAQIIFGKWLHSNLVWLYMEFFRLSRAIIFSKEEVICIGMQFVTVRKYQHRGIWHSVCCRWRQQVDWESANGARERGSTVLC